MLVDVWEQHVRSLIERIIAVKATGGDPLSLQQELRQLVNNMPKEKQDATTKSQPLPPDRS